MAAFPVLAGATAVPNNFITLAQAEATIGPNGIGIGERGRNLLRYSEAVGPNAWNIMPVGALP